MNDERGLDCRPKYHFSPRKGWLNDPNGLVMSDGIYHLFFQHDPNGVMHGPMHWGHATSSNLAEWDERAIALYPDASGNCFSGSAVAAAVGDVAGELQQASFLMFYTASLPRPGTYDFQTQCLALADRNLSTFERYPGNPVIDNPGIEVFRDPKVFWHSDTGRWIMVVTLGQSIGFYSSRNALDWEFESTFGENHGWHGEGPWECPDLFPLLLGDDTYWVLVVGIGKGAFSGGSGTQYFVGLFDGYHFTSINDPAATLWLDHGTDFYAAQSWSGLPEGQAVIIAWMGNWNYATATPARSYRGVMSLPRHLTLADGEDGIRLRQTIVDSVSDALPRLCGRLSAADDGLALSTEAHAARVRVQIELQCDDVVGLYLFETELPLLTFTRSGAQILVRLQRSSVICGGRELEGYGTDCSFEFAHPGQLDLDIFVDEGLVEIGLAEGAYWISSALHSSVANVQLQLKYHNKE